MTNSNTGGRRLAILAGALATAGALTILLQDALASGNWKIEHGLIPVLMGVQILTGHLATAALRQWRVIPTIGFFLVAAVATWGVLYTSVGKQSAVQADAALEAKDIEARRAPISKMISDAEFLLADCPAGTAPALFGEKCGLRAAMIAECKSGKGKRCDGKSYSVTTYEAAIKGYSKDLAEIGPPKATDARAATMAKVISKIWGNSEDVTRETLTLIEPFTYAMIFELAALVSFGFAFGHASRPASRQPSATETAQTSFPATGDLSVVKGYLTTDTVATRNRGNSGNGGGKGGNGGVKIYSREEAERDLVTRLALGETVAAQDELADRWGVHKATVSKWLKVWEADGLIPARRRIGRTMQLASA